MSYIYILAAFIVGGTLLGTIIGAIYLKIKNNSLKNKLPNKKVASNNAK